MRLRFMACLLSVGEDIQGECSSAADPESWRAQEEAVREFRRTLEQSERLEDEWRKSLTDEIPPELPIGVNSSYEATRKSEYSSQESKIAVQNLMQAFATKSREEMRCALEDAFMALEQSRKDLKRSERALEKSERTLDRRAKILLQSWRTAKDEAEDKLKAMKSAVKKSRQAETAMVEAVKKLRSRSSQAVEPGLTALLLELRGREKNNFIEFLELGEAHEERTALKAQEKAPPKLWAAGSGAEKVLELQAKIGEAQRTEIDDLNLIGARVLFRERFILLEILRESNGMRRSFLTTLERDLKKTRHFFSRARM